MVTGNAAGMSDPGKAELRLPRREAAINSGRCMKISTVKITCLLTAGAFLASAPRSRAQIPYVPSLPFHHDNTAEQVVTAVVVAATIYFIARYEATERQRQVAEMRARQSYARMPA